MEKERKGNKKAMKKEEPIEPVGQVFTVKDVKLSNMDLSIGYPSDSKWVAS